MQNFRVFFVNHFDTDRLSDDKVRKFAEDNLQRMANSGLYPTLTADTQTAYQLYFGAIVDEATKTAIREGQTMSVDLAMKAIKDAVSQQEGAVRAKYGKDSPTYQEFLPHGVTEYAKATLENIEEITVRFFNAADVHKGDLPGLNTQFGTLRDNFVLARTAQLGSKGQIATGKADASAKRDVVETQLTKNLLTIALDHIADPAGGLAFFDESILTAGNKPEAGAPPPPPGP